MPSPGLPGISCLNLSPKIISRCLEQFPHELCDISIFHPCGAQPHFYFRSVKILWLHFLKIFHIKGIFRMIFCITLCNTQFFPDIAGKVFVRCLPFFRHRVLKDYSGKFLCDFLLRFPTESSHKRYVHPCFLPDGYCKGFAGGIHAGDGFCLPYGTFCKDIRLTLQISVLVNHLQRCQKAVAGIL
ncbi:hypothetical protein IMSAGC019_00345 [Lachnospiraceae bacterium]|nr:hypothetical protein IMSAGC019_00345 [Lachnospiraceae bacterium]